ncbi:MAG: GIY-YIG nuclease family protein [Bacteroidetes bacterium]|nr:GIY-YIG nuclease family protein [Bacteroidota bacterium]
MKEWSAWRPMPSPERCKEDIEGPAESGVYQIRNKKTGQYIQFGESKNCRKRMKSFFPKPYGTGTRNNEKKRIYILENWQYLEYRTIATDSKQEAVQIDRELKSQNIHLFNT